MISLEVDRKEKLITASIENGERFTKNGIRKAWHQIGAENQREARKQIRSGGRSGRTYTIKGRRHRASAPGEVPANLTGTLARSVFYRVNSWYKMTFGDSAEYAQYLEPNRPFLIKVINERAGENINTILDYVDKEI